MLPDAFEKTETILRGILLQRSSGFGQGRGTRAPCQGDELRKKCQEHRNVVLREGREFLKNALLKARELLIKLQKLGSGRMFFGKLARAGDTMVPGECHKNQPLVL